MRIAPRTLLWGNGWRVDANISGHFKELRELCALAGDKASLALGMGGMVLDHMMHARVREASRLASEQMALLDSIGDPALTVGAGFMAIIIKHHTGERSPIYRGGGSSSIEAVGPAASVLTWSGRPCRPVRG